MSNVNHSLQLNGSVYCHNEQLAETISALLREQGFGVAMSSTVATLPTGVTHVKRLDVVVTGKQSPYPSVVTSWDDLTLCTSVTHVLETNVEKEHARIYCKGNPLEFVAYLPSNALTSVHADKTEQILNDFGFNVLIAMPKQTITQSEGN